MATIYRNEHNLPALAAKMTASYGARKAAKASSDESAALNIQRDVTWREKQRS